jgi:hypothetical protein
MLVKKRDQRLEESREKAMEPLSDKRWWDRGSEQY